MSWRQKIAILIWMQFLNDIIKSRHGFKAAQKFHKFRVFTKTLKLQQPNLLIFDTLVYILCTLPNFKKNKFRA